MKTGYRGTFVISWLQTEIDGLNPCDIGAINIGTTWRWTGAAVRVDDPRDILLLEGGEGIEELHLRAAMQVRKSIGAQKFRPHVGHSREPGDPLFSSGFDVTDGINRYRATLVESEDSHYPMLLFNGAVPPVDEDLWVVNHKTDNLRTGGVTSGGVVCFVRGTRLNSPDGQVLVEELAPGDRINTKDNGVQTVRWIGKRGISGGRFQAMPHLRPIRLREDFLNVGEPDRDLLVSPDHRILISGNAAQSLFNTSEVLVTARDLINDSTVTVDHTLKEVTYIHIMFDAHQIVWANGVACESFHPANAKLDQIETGQRLALMQQFPTIADNPFDYGEFARRNLTRGEAAILSYDRLGGH